MDDVPVPERKLGFQFYARASEWAIYERKVTELDDYGAMLDHL